MATGLLIVCTGNKTKEISKYQNLKKTYLAKIKLGYITESFDRETAELNQKDYKKVPFKKIKNFINFFLGEQTQIPPKFSAIKVNGKRAYEKARKNDPSEDLKSFKSAIMYSKIKVLAGPEK